MKSSRVPAALEHGGSQAVLDHAGHHRLGQAHHVVVVGVGLVELQHGELRIVGPVHALVPEVVADLVDPLEAAHQEPLEVQLVGDPQVERHVQRIVVGDERPGRGAAVERLQDRGLDLEKPPLVEEPPDEAR